MLLCWVFNRALRCQSASEGCRISEPACFARCIARHHPLSPCCDRSPEATLWRPSCRRRCWATYTRAQMVSIERVPALRSRPCLDALRGWSPLVDWLALVQCSAESRAYCGHFTLCLLASFFRQPKAASESSSSPSVVVTRLDYLARGASVLWAWQTTRRGTASWRSCAHASACGASKLCITPLVGQSCARWTSCRTLKT